MLILGTEPSSMILSQTNGFQQLKSDVPKVPNQAEAKGHSLHRRVINDFRWKNKAQ